MIEYSNLLGGNSDLSLQQILTMLIDFFKSPEGWAFIAVILVGVFVYKR